VNRSRSKAVFLDRDGTLMWDPGFCSDPSQVELLPGIPAALARLQSAGFKLVIVTNQSGIGRGFFTEAEFRTVQDRLQELLKPVEIAAVYFCPDHPDRATNWRKPGPGMLLQAAENLDIDLSASFMVGDKESDVQAGVNAGVQAAIRVDPSADGLAEIGRNVWVVQDLEAAADVILRLGD
jgi:D-glycero-D-manno-heptose 1,7-bisphosphate phosphatase